MTGLAFGDLLREKTYVFAYDWADPKCNSAAILAYIKDSRTVSSWSIPFPGMFLLRSYTTAPKLFEGIQAILGDVRCYITEIDISNSTGWLPRAAWDWLLPPTVDKPGTFPNALLGPMTSNKKT